MIGKTKKFIKNFFRLIEFGIVILLLVTILFTFKELILVLIDEIHNNNLLEHYKTIISEILLLAVGVEIVFLIIKKDLFFVIDILVLAIARKLITYDDNMDILVSVICICVLLITKALKRKFLLGIEKE